MRGDIVGVLLAGGLGRRMGGGDKALRPLAGRPLISHTAERLRPQVDRLIVNANGDPGRMAFLDLPVVPDERPDFAGPLAGVLAAIHWASRNTPTARWIVSVPADAPFVPDDLISRFAAAAGDSSQDLVAVAQSRGRRHHVVALWPLSAGPAIEAALARGERKVETMIESLGAAAVPFPDLEIAATPVDPFFNVNTPDDLALADRLRAQAAIPPPSRGRIGERNVAFVVGVAGWKNSGKTTLVERLIAALVTRGLRVSSVKHSHHTLGIEHEGSDSARHRLAGAHQVALAGTDRWGIIESSEEIAWQDGPPPDLAGVVARLDPADIVIVEGFKSAPIPKIEVRRSGQGEGPPLSDGDPGVFAVASDTRTAGGQIPAFHLDDTAGIVRAILKAGGFAEETAP